MALSFALIASHMVAYIVKATLLVFLAGAPAVRAHFIVLATVHVVTNTHSAFVVFNGAPRVPRCTVPVAVAVFGALTPLMQVVHLRDAVVLACWPPPQSAPQQDIARRLHPYSAPLDILFEGLFFLLAGLHLWFGLVLGEAPVEAPPWWRGSIAEVTFEVLLTASMALSLLTCAMSLVVWDSKMYGWPGQKGRPGRGCCHIICGFLCHTVLRASEVAGRVVVVAVVVTLCRPSYAAGYLAVAFLLNVTILQRASEARRPQQAPAAGFLCLSAIALAWPLLFVNLTQFVDWPGPVRHPISRHLAAAQSAATALRGVRLLELLVAVGAISAAVHMDCRAQPLSQEEELGRVCPWIRGEHIVQNLQTLHERRVLLGGGICLLVHYTGLVIRWCCPAFAELLPGGSPGSRSYGAQHIAHPGFSDTLPLLPPQAGQSGTQEAWPQEAASLAQLLVAVSESCRPASAWPLDGGGSVPAGGPSRPQGRQLRVEDFDILRVIGSGEFGKVYQARLRATSEVFAMKRLSKEFYYRRRMADKAVREMTTLHAAQEHPFVVKLACVMENAHEWALVLEYCQRGDLQQFLLAEGCPGLPLDRTLRISAEVALALEHLHLRGIVFRDLKLENVVLDLEGHVKLTDFGLAKQHGWGYDAIREAQRNGGIYASFTKTFCGSYGYAAPEVNPCRQVHGFAADMYSFGVLVLMLLMGGEVYHDLREPPWERRLPPETPADLRGIVDRLGFDFYWTTHHLLQPARASHRVEVNLTGQIVLASQGQRGVRRRARPHRPPTTPREQSPDSGAPPPVPPPAHRPLHFPDAACVASEAMQHRWALALDLVRLLTNEQPDQRGTIAALKEHPFFAEEIADWRAVYPRSWLMDRLLGLLQRRSGSGDTSKSGSGTLSPASGAMGSGSGPPTTTTSPRRSPTPPLQQQHQPLQPVRPPQASSMRLAKVPSSRFVRHLLEELSVQELAALQDDEEAQVALLHRARNFEESPAATAMQAPGGGRPTSTASPSLEGRAAHLAPLEPPRRSASATVSPAATPPFAGWPSGERPWPAPRHRPVRSQGSSRAPSTEASTHSWVSHYS